MRLLKLFKGRSRRRSKAHFAKSGLDRARLLREKGDVWGAFTVLREEYTKNSSEEIAAELSSLMGTSSSYHDVLAAMAAEFDNSYYLNANPDVRLVTKEGDQHYLLYGWKENRNTSPFFDGMFYRTRHPELEDREFPLSHFVKHGKAAGIPANLISDKYWFIPDSPTSDQWLNAAPAKMGDKTRAVVIIPVYKGYEETMTAIYQALVSRQGDDYSLLVVNDKSPDSQINETLQSLADQGLFDYHASAINRGFVQTCNFAIRELSLDLDVVLLNSDAYVFPGWFSRLAAHAADPSVATVTPLSNNATICSYPLINHDNCLSLECTPQDLDALAARTNPGLAIEAPTGVGFCFYMRRAVIKKIGALDVEAFKVGYGEENDFCMRALNAGYKNLIAADVFVFHTGSVSFSTIKEENFSKGQQALETKHPNYSSLVRNHIAADPERSARRRLDLARLSSATKGATIFVTHRWNGGIETYLKHERLKLDQDRQPHLTLRVHNSHRVTIESDGGPFVPNLADIDLRTESPFLRDLLAAIAPTLLHVNSFAGLDWVWHRKLLDFIQSSGTPYKYVCHDYSSISHHYQLIRPDIVYSSAPSLDQRVAWSTMTDHSGSTDVCDPEERLTAYRSFLFGASQVEVPSNAAKEILAREFPGVSFAVVPHDDHLPEFPPAQRRPHDGKTRVAVIGAIGPHKGSDVLASLAADAQNRNLDLEYVLIGYSNDDGRLQSFGATVTGQYRTEKEALKRVSEFKPDIVFIPSIWPETFCYALSMAIKLKIPPVVFDIGAQAERVSALGWGATLPIQLAYDPCRLSERLLSLQIDKMWGDKSRASVADKAA